MNKLMKKFLESIKGLAMNLVPNLGQNLGSGSGPGSRPGSSLTSKHQSKIPAYLGIGLILGVFLMLIGGPISRRWDRDPHLPGMSERDYYDGAVGIFGIYPEDQSRSQSRSQSGSQSESKSGAHGHPNQHQGYDSYSYERVLERRLEEVLSLAEGVGEVRVLVNFIQGPTTVFAVDRSLNYSSTQEQDAQGGTRNQTSQQGQDKTLIITDRSGVGQPLIVTENPPVIGGVVIIAEGGENVLVREALTRAASTLLDIDIDRVQVMTMRRQQ